MNASLGFIILPTLTLIAGVVDDLRSRKVHNWLVLSALGLNLVGGFFLGGWSAVQSGLMAAVVAITLTLPLVSIKALGAGDMKILTAFAVATHWSAVLSVVLYSLLWGALLGLLQAALKKELGTLVKGMVGVVKRQGPAPENLHKIPYTVALMFGWLTYLSLMHWNLGGVL